MLLFSRSLAKRSARLLSTGTGESIGLGAAPKITIAVPPWGLVDAGFHALAESISASKLKH